MVGKFIQYRAYDAVFSYEFLSRFFQTREQKRERFLSSSVEKATAVGIYTQYRISISILHTYEQNTFGNYSK